MHNTNILGLGVKINMTRRKQHPLPLSFHLPFYNVVIFFGKITAKMNQNLAEVIRW